VDTNLFATSRVIIVVGKGGVGKTTVTATIALAQANAGRNVLVIETEPDGPVARCFERERFGYDAVALWGPSGDDRAGRVDGRAVTAAAALDDYLKTHGLSVLLRAAGRRSVAGRPSASGRPSAHRAPSGIDVLATAAPGIDDLLILGKVRAIDAEDLYDLIIIDGPAAGHAVSLLRAAAGLLEIVQRGPIHEQALEVDAMLRDPRRCQVVLVTSAEETPVTETIETAFTLEDELGVHLGPIVVNALEPHGTPTEAVIGVKQLTQLIRHGDPSMSVTAATQAAEATLRADRYRRSQLDRQERNLTRLSESLGLAQLRLTRLATADIGRREMAQLARQLTEQL
jgi:anion-transporting  ArsA/GET3 family ATPase